MENEATTRLGAFLGILAVMAVWEWLVPRRVLTESKARRWRSNLVIGAHPLGVLIFEVALNGTAMFNHSNAHVPIGFDRILRWFVVTPDMHRVHHSVEQDETNNNFGFNLPWWDRLFGTYRAQPREGHENMTIGLQTFRDPRLCLPLRSMLRLPFLGEVGGYAINRREWKEKSKT